MEKNQKSANSQHKTITVIYSSRLNAKEDKSSKTRTDRTTEAQTEKANNVPFEKPAVGKKNT